MVPVTEIYITPILHISPIYLLHKEKLYLSCDQLLFIYFLCLLLGIQEGDKQFGRETSTHQLNSERYVHTFKDLSNFSGAINVTYRYLAATPLQRKRKYLYTCKSRTCKIYCFKIMIICFIFIAIKVSRLYQCNIFFGKYFNVSS